MTEIRVLPSLIAARLGRFPFRRRLIFERFLMILGVFRAAALPAIKRARQIEPDLQILHRVRSLEGSSARAQTSDVRSLRLNAEVTPRNAKHNAKITRE
jgi:hypothetical protein